MLSINLIQICVLILVADITANQDGPKLKLDQGELQGKYLQTWKGRTISAYTGIPYAQPPIGDLRFKLAVPATDWEGVLDATKPHAVCPQVNFLQADQGIIGNEDCLYLNVYTPQLPSSHATDLPVMFFLHGGGWFLGNANAETQGPAVLLDKDIVLVVPNYRLGALGFLSTGDEVVPGNNGLKDQNLALKWVKKNIAHFGGDPERITIFGQSAGGASTHYHMLSPLSRELFQGAIAQSGTALACWSLAQEGEGVRNSKKLAEFLHCPSSSSQEMVDCLRKVNVTDIIAQDPKFSVWHYDPIIPFKPVIEPDIEGAFLAEDPIDIIKSGKAANIPFMSGITTEEGAYKTAALCSDSTLMQELNGDFNSKAPSIFMYDDSVADKNGLSNKIKEFYFGKKDIDKSTKIELTNMVTDVMFFSSQSMTVQLHAKYSAQKQYYYIFGYRGSTSFTYLFANTTEDYGVCHCDELLYLFSSVAFSAYKPNEDDKTMIDILVTLWTNFAKTGNPTPGTDSLIKTKWEPVHSENLEYYLIKGKNDLTMAKNAYSDRDKFWRHLPINLRRKNLEDELIRV